MSYGSETRILSGLVFKLALSCYQLYLSHFLCNETALRKKTILNSAVCLYILYLIGPHGHCLTEEGSAVASIKVCALPAEVWVRSWISQTDVVH